MAILYSQNHIASGLETFAVNSPISESVMRFGENQNSLFASWNAGFNVHFAGPTAEYLEISGTMTGTLCTAKILVPSGSRGLNLSCFGRVSGSGDTLTVKLASKYAEEEKEISWSDTAKAWKETTASCPISSEYGFEMISLDFQKTGIGGRVYDATIAFAPYGTNGTYPNGVFGDFEPVDLDRFDKDSPLSTGGLKQLYNNGKALLNGFPMPVFMALGCLGYTTKDAIFWTTRTDYAYLLGNIPYWKRNGENVDSLTVSVLSYCDTTGTLSTTARYQDNAISTLASNVPQFDAEWNALDPATWITFELDISDVPEDAEEPIFIDMFAKSSIAGDDVCIYSVVIQETPKGIT